MELLRILEGIRTPFLDNVVGLVTRLGEETVGIVLLCLVFWCVSKRVAYVLGISFFLSSLSVQGMKICFRVDRPWIADPTLKPVPSAIEHATGYSFPSGHTQSATAIFGGLGAQIKQKPVMALCFLLPVLVAFSRMYLGVHTLADVTVSLLITLLFVLLTVKLLANEEMNKKRDFIVSLVIMLFAVAVVIVAFVLYSGGTIAQNYVADCMKAAGAAIGFAVGMYIERNHIKFSVKSKNILLHAVKFVLGIAGVLAIQEGLKLIIGSGLAANMFRYCLMLIWITVLFPLIIKRFFAEKAQ